MGFLLLDSPTKLVKIVNETLNVLAVKLFGDNFTRDDSDTVGNDWVEDEPLAGTCLISSNELHIVGSDASVERPAAEAWADGKITTKVRVSQLNSEAAVLARYSAADTYWYVSLTVDDFTLKWFDGGDSATADSESFLELGDDEWYEIEFTLNGSSISVTLKESDGTLVSTLSVTDAIHATVSGKQRLMGIDNFEFQLVEFDDFSHYPLDVEFNLLRYLGRFKLINESLNFVESCLKFIVVDFFKVQLKNITVKKVLKWFR